MDPTNHLDLDTVLIRSHTYTYMQKNIIFFCRYKSTAHPSHTSQPTLHPVSDCCRSATTGSSCCFCSDYWKNPNPTSTLWTASSYHIYSIPLRLSLFHCFLSLFGPIGGTTHSLSPSEIDKIHRYGQSWLTLGGGRCRPLLLITLCSPNRSCEFGQGSTIFPRSEHLHTPNHIPP